MEILALIFFILIGIAAGLLAGMLGLSGGVITVPCLAFLFHLLNFPQVYTMQLAIGTSLAAMVITGISSALAHQKRGGIVWDSVLSLLPGIFLGCLIGSSVAHFLSSVMLRIVFGLFLSFLGAFTLLKKGGAKEKKRAKRAVMTWTGLGIGSLSSLLGIGGGVFIVPLLLSYGFAEKKAIGTSAMCSLILTFLAAVAYLYFGLNQLNLRYTFGYIYLPAFLLVGLGAASFAPLGAKLAHQMDGKKLRKIFAITLILVGILMIF